MIYVVPCAGTASEEKTCCVVISEREEGVLVVRVFSSEPPSCIEGDRLVIPMDLLENHEQN